MTLALMIAALNRKRFVRESFGLRGRTGWLMSVMGLPL
jgi:hypothetical protein